MTLSVALSVKIPRIAVNHGTIRLAALTERIFMLLNTLLLFPITRVPAMPVEAKAGPPLHKRYPDPPPTPLVTTPNRTRVCIAVPGGKLLTTGNDEEFHHQNAIVTIICDVMFEVVQPPHKDSQWEPKWHTM